MGRRKTRSRKTPKRKKLISFSQEVKKGILVVLLATFAVISLLSFFNQAGKLGEIIYVLSFNILGEGYKFLPLFLFVAAAGILWTSKEQSSISSLLGSFLLVLSVEGLLQVFSSPGSEKLGGYLGFGIAWPFLYILGKWATFVLLTGLFFISILIAFNISLISLFRREKKREDISKALEPKNEDKEKISVFGSLSDITKKIIPRPKFSVKKIDDILKMKDAGINTQGEKNLRGSVGLETGIEKLEYKGAVFKPPPLDLLDRADENPTSGDIKANANVIQRTLANFGIDVEMSEINIGPAVTQYTLKPATGVKLVKIVSLQNDLALALAAHPLRIEAPIPGRSLVGIEIPNRVPSTVRLRNLLDTYDFKKTKSLLNIVLGRDVSGNPIWTNIGRMPHLLIAGSTGAGKTVCINSLIATLLFQNSPETLKFIFVDPKRVELTLYNGIPHLITPVVTEAKKTVNVLKWVVSEMDARYHLLAEIGARDILSYNSKARKDKSRETLPYIVFIVDELADLMASYGREIEGTIVRLAQMSRAVGIHLILATQRPSVEVITGLIKANITTRIAFQVASQIDSRTILDMAGAEKLLGGGDMLYLAGDASKPKRIQGAYISEKEIKRLVNFLVKSYQENGDEVDFGADVSGAGTAGRIIDFETETDVDDDLYPDAKEVVIKAKKASASLLQRRLRVGYARAARLLDILEDKGVVGPQDGSKPREVYVDSEQEDNIKSEI